MVRIASANHVGAMNWQTRIDSNYLFALDPSKPDEPVERTFCATLLHQEREMSLQRGRAHDPLQSTVHYRKVKRTLLRTGTGRPL